MGRNGKGLMAALGFIFIVLSMWFLGRSFLQGVEQAGGIGNLLNFDVPLFAASSALLAVHLLMAGWTWDLVTRVAGGRIGFRKAFAIHFLSQVGKYVPGKVWAVMGKYGLSRSGGLQPVQIGQGLILETVFIVLGCLVTVIPLMPLAASEAGMGAGTGTALAAVLAAVLLASVHPWFFQKLAALAARVMKTGGTLRKCRFTEMLAILPAYVALFVFLGSAFWLLALSFGLRMPFFPGIFIYPAAMGIGYLTIFSPGGLGARELSTVWLIKLLVPECEPGLPELVSLVARLWITIGEVAAFGVSFPLMGITPARMREVFSPGGLSHGDTVKGDEGQDV